jgi:hypothetical protein
MHAYKHHHLSSICTIHFCKQGPDPIMSTSARFRGGWARGSCMVCDLSHRTIPSWEYLLDFEEGGLLALAWSVTFHKGLDVLLERSTQEISLFPVTNEVLVNKYTILNYGVHRPWLYVLLILLQSRTNLYLLQLWCRFNSNNASTHSERHDIVIFFREKTWHRWRPFN